MLLTRVMVMVSAFRQETRTHACVRKDFQELIVTLVLFMIIFHLFARDFVQFLKSYTSLFRPIELWN